MDITNRVREWYDHKFYSVNDAAHGMPHIEEVLANILRMNILLDANLDEYILVMCVFNHDIFSGRNRELHHILAAKYVRYNNSNPFLQLLSAEEREIVAKAVSEHRSSGPDVYSNQYSRLLRLADKGRPNNMPGSIRRSYQFYRPKCSSHIETICMVLAFFTTKYGREGYGFKSLDYQAIYMEDIRVYWDQVDALTYDSIAEMVSVFDTAID